MIDESGEAVRGGSASVDLATGGLYRAVPFTAYPLDRMHTLLLSPASDEVQFVRTTLATVLAACQVPRTMDEHIRWVSARLPADVPASRVESMVGQLVSAGALVPCSQATTGGSAHITTIAVMATAGGHQLERCLHSYLAHLREGQRAATVLVVDGVAGGGMGDAGRTLCSVMALQYGVPVTVVGHEERRRLREALIQDGMTAAIVDRALGDREDRTWGALFNTLLLLTRGRHVLCVDDETVATPWAWPGRKPEIRIGGHIDPYRYEFARNARGGSPACGMDWRGPSGGPRRMRRQVCD